MRLTIDCKTSAGGRAGRLELAHATVSTPAFMPCASHAVVRACPPRVVSDLGIEVMICNAYHLWQRPGAEVIAQMGGLHEFMSWPGALMTDSGGFQAFSISGNAGVSEEGFRFRSHLSGAELNLTPELSIELQEQLGSDVAMVLDECVAYPAEHDYVAESVRRTARWAARCRQAHQRADQALFGIVQGGVYPELRACSAQMTVDIGFDGYAIGGLSVGESRQEMLSALDAVLPHLPADVPRYVMGVGTPMDIVECARLGVDLFDCVLPTRNARHASLVTWSGPLKLGRREFATDERPIDTDCCCPTCLHYSRAYLHHLHRANEAAAWTLLSVHNLHFYVELMDRLRDAIARDTVCQLQRELHPWTRRDEQ